MYNSDIERTYSKDRVNLVEEKQQIHDKNGTSVQEQT